MLNLHFSTVAPTFMELSTTSLPSLLSFRNTIKYKHEYYYSGINPVEFRGLSKHVIVEIIEKLKIELNA